MKKTNEELAICLLGDSGCGKTCISLRYLYDDFSKVHDPTIVDFYSCDDVIDGKKVKVNIIDSAGMDDYETLIANNIRDSDGVLLCYAVDDRSSFKKMRKFHEDVMRIAEGMPIVLFGNKLDLVDENARKLDTENPHIQIKKRVVSKTEGQNFAHEKNIKCFKEGSALCNIKIKDSFHTLVRMIRSYRMEQAKRIELSQRHRQTHKGPKSTGISSSSKSQVDEDVRMFSGQI